MIGYSSKLSRLLTLIYSSIVYININTNVTTMIKVGATTMAEDPPILTFEYNNSENNPQQSNDLIPMKIITRRQVNTANGSVTYTPKTWSFSFNGEGGTGKQQAKFTFNYNGLVKTLKLNGSIYKFSHRKNAKTGDMQLKTIRCLKQCEKINHRHLLLAQDHLHDIEGIPSARSSIIHHQQQQQGNSLHENIHQNEISLKPITWNKDQKAISFHSYNLHVINLGQRNLNTSCNICKSAVTAICTDGIVNQFKTCNKVTSSIPPSPVKVAVTLLCAGVTAGLCYVGSEVICDAVCDDDMCDPINQKECDGKCVDKDWCCVQDGDKFCDDGSNICIPKDSVGTMCCPNSEKLCGPKWQKYKDCISSTLCCHYYEYSCQGYALEFVCESRETSCLCSDQPVCYTSIIYGGYKQATCYDPETELCCHEHCPFGQKSCIKQKYYGNCAQDI